MAFKMKAGKEGPMKKNFGISPMKNYKKGYYGEGSSMKLTDDDETTKTGHNLRMSKIDYPRFAMKKEVKQLRRMKKEVVPNSKYTGRTPQSQMTDAEYKRMLQKKKKK